MQVGESIPKNLTTINIQWKKMDGQLLALLHAQMDNEKFEYEIKCGFACFAITTNIRKIKGGKEVRTHSKNIDHVETSKTIQSPRVSALKQENASHNS